MMQVDALPDDLRYTARDFSVWVVARVQGERGLVLLGKFKRDLEGKNGQFTSKGGSKITCQGLDYLVAMAPE
jgi:hypothetical protein